MPYDHDALPALIEVMAACGYHDRDAARAGLDRAEAALGPGRHKARADLHAARTAAEQGDWVLCWGRAWQATCGLTHAFPPDLSACPPRPHPTQPFAVGACACGAVFAQGVRFCARCGAPAI